MRKPMLLVLAFALVLTLMSLGFTAPTKADDSEGTPTTPCLNSTPDGTAVGTLESDAALTVSYVGIISQNADGDIILTTVDGDEIVVAPASAFVPGQLDMTLTYEITGTETEDGTLQAESIEVVDVATATPEATLDGTPTATPEATAVATSDGCESNAGEKVTVCHLPGGDINKARTLTIGAPALPAHLAHGDYVGPCAKEGKHGKPDNPGNGKGGGQGKH